MTSMHRGKQWVTETTVAHLKPIQHKSQSACRAAGLLRQSVSPPSLIFPFLVLLLLHSEEQKQQCENNIHSTSPFTEHPLNTSLHNFLHRAWWSLWSIDQTLSCQVKPGEPVALLQVTEQDESQNMTAVDWSWALVLIKNVTTYCNLLLLLNYHTFVYNISIFFFTKVCSVRKRFMVLR